MDTSNVIQQFLGSFIMYYHHLSVHFTLNVISHLSYSLICISEIYTVCTYHYLICTTRGSVNGMDISPFGDSICSVGDDGLIQTFAPDAKTSSIISMCGMVRTCMGWFDSRVTSLTMHGLFSAGIFNSLILLLLYFIYFQSTHWSPHSLTPRFCFWCLRLVPRACNQWCEISVQQQHHHSVRCSASSGIVIYGTVSIILPSVAMGPP